MALFALKGRIMSEVVDFTSAAESGALPSLDGDEVLGEPTSRIKSKTNVQRFAILGLVVFAILLIVAGLMFYQKMRKPSAQRAEASGLAKLENQTKNAAVENASIEATKAAIKKAADEEAARLAREQAEIEAAAAAAAKQQPPAAQVAPGAPGAPVAPPQTAEDRRLGGPVLLDSAAGPKSSTAADQGAQREYQARMAAINAGGGGAAGAMTVGGKSGGTSELGTRLQPTVFEARSAGRLGDLSYLLKKGTSIPCALKTGIDTTLPGIVVCNVLNDVYSANGKTVLIERGAGVFGEQQSSIKQGQARTFVVWSRIDNPSGVFANIDSPAADQMGYSGIPGFVDNHFWERFGGAIMMSLISDFSFGYSQRVANSTRNKDEPVQNYSNTQQAAQDMATEALRNSINIPPTLVVNPATVINIMVARDVSFKTVYDLVE